MERIKYSGKMKHINLFLCEANIIEDEVVIELRLPQKNEIIFAVTNMDGIEGLSKILFDYFKKKPSGKQTDTTETGE